MNGSLFLDDIWLVSPVFPRSLWIRQGPKILGKFEIFLDKNKNPAVKERKDRE